MLLHVPASLDGLLSLFASCFTQPTFQTFRALVVGQIAQTQRRTVCGMLVGARLSGVWHHARAHRFFSCARWSTDELGLRLAVLICQRLLPPGAPVLIAVDDSLCRRRGRKVHGAFWHRDVAANSEGLVAAWGHSWVVAGIVLELAFLQRAVCLPVLFRLWRPKRKQFGYHSDPERPGKPELAREMVDLLASRLPERELHLVGDSAYATKTWRGLNRVSVTFRTRASTTLYGPTPPPSGRRGYPRRWGARLGTPAQITQHPSTRWSKHTIHCYGHTQTATIAAIDCLWKPLGSQTPLRLIIARQRTKHHGPQIALLTSDRSTNPAQIIERYANRWPIEVCFEQAKQLFGVGHPRNRTPKAVHRTVPFQYLAMSLTITWYALHGHHPDIVTEHRRRAPWYLTKTTPSLADMLTKLRRVILAAQYHPQQAHTPTNQEITQVQQAWAAAGL